MTHIFSKTLSDQQVAFEKVVNYLEENGRDEIITIKDLHDYMASICDEPYTALWIKRKLEKSLPDDIIICSRFGRDNVVVFHESLNDHLLQFRLVEHSNYIIIIIIS